MITRRSKTPRAVAVVAIVELVAAIALVLTGAGRLAVVAGSAALIALGMALARPWIVGHDQ